MNLILALFLAVPSISRAADIAQPAPGTWSVGVTGFDNTAVVGNPNVRYVATDKTTLELTPVVNMNDSRELGTVSNSQSYGVIFDVLREIGIYKGTKLSWVVQPSASYTYNKLSSFGSTTKTPEPGFGIGAGFEIERFIEPNLSVSARALLDFGYASMNGETNGVHFRGSDKTFAIAGQALSMHYYFNDDWRTVEPAPSDRGRWAVGWQGQSGALNESFAEPSLKYVINDRWAVEAVPTYLYSHSDSGGSLTHIESFLFAADAERTLARSHGVQLSWLIQPAFGYSHQQFATPPVSSSRVWDYEAELGTGFEIEYFVWPDLSIGARGLLNYSNSHLSTYALTGYAGQGLTNQLSIIGQILSVRWYF